MKSYQELYNTAKKSKAVKSLSPTYIKWEKEGQVIIGAFVSYSSVQSVREGSEYNQYIFDTDKGLVKFALGKSADSEVTPQLARGVVYAITFLGKENISRARTVNRFLVEEIGIADQVDDTETNPLTDDK